MRYFQFLADLRCGSQRFVSVTAYTFVYRHRSDGGSWEFLFYLSQDVGKGDAVLSSRYGDDYSVRRLEHVIFGNCSSNLIF